MLGGDPEKYRVPTKTATGNQNKHQVSTKRPGGQQKPGAHQKELWVPTIMQVPAKTPRGQQKKRRVTKKKPGDPQDARCLPKLTAGAHYDVRWPQNCPMHTKRNARCPPIKNLSAHHD